ncbi:hypothetical protein OB955_06310 [Halobacteria archaeon AArc-m2/3/4]|uniref:CRISPR-associated exonuclease Cas4 n=1 Tax=Natronoglomus mannanivorans TaxID=2979990 RepID=A0AAP2YXA9_9EURY|nr:hypothetical protein [Halobacteria archaeon AArc-xg1-1]MCU4972348.1 hypothetical protein [Halobacteria archaeon AArc-m2/3/4]
MPVPESGSESEPTSVSASPVAFSDLRTAAYCPRKCYYRRRDAERGSVRDGDDTPDSSSIEIPDDVSRIRSLAFRYPDLLEASDDELTALPIAVDPRTYRRTLEETRDRLEHWDELREPTDRHVLLSGRDCRGVVHKMLESAGEGETTGEDDALLAPSLLSTGEPPENGVWKPQTVHAVAAAKALAWDRQQPVEVAYLEYPAYGVIRRLELTTRRKALYRRALRTVREIDGPPARVKNRSKCESCEYAGECGVRTRTLRSLLRLE